MEPSHDKRDLGIVPLVVLQRRMHSHPVEPGLRLFYLREWAGRALVRLSRCAGSLESSLLAFVIIILFIFQLIHDMTKPTKLVSAWSKLGYPLSAQRRHWSDWADDTLCWFCHGSVFLALTSHMEIPARHAKKNTVLCFIYVFHGLWNFVSCSSEQGIVLR